MADGIDRRLWVVGVLVALAALAYCARLLVAGHPSHHVDPTTDAYKIGYSNIYEASGRQAAAYRHNPKYNPYLTMPRSQWAAYAAQQTSEGDDGQCDSFRVGTGGWDDYAAGARRALQDLAAGHGPRIHGYDRDPDCD